jgi:hypothetical protein
MYEQTDGRTNKCEFIGHLRLEPGVQYREYLPITYIQTANLLGICHLLQKKNYKLFYAVDILIPFRNVA